MSSKPKEMTPFGKALSGLGFIAGFAFGLQVTEDSVIVALGCGLLVASVGALIGDTLWKVVVVCLAIAIALVAWKARTEVARALVEGLRSAGSIESSETTPSSPPLVDSSPRPRSRPQQEAAPKPHPTLPDTKMHKHPREQPSAPDGTHGLLFASRADADLYADPKTKRIYIFHAPRLEYSRYEKAVYYSRSRSLVFVDRRGRKYLFPAKIGDAMHKYFMKVWFEELDVVRTESRKPVEGMVLPIIKY